MRNFEFAVDPTGDLGGALNRQFANGTIGLDDETLHIVLGSPPAFEVQIPRSSIESAERAPDLRHPTRGVHGGRKRWLVNRSGGDLVRLGIRPAATAAIIMSEETLSRQPGGRISRALLKRMMRPRTVEVAQLTLSVASPDEFVRSLTDA